MKFSQNALKQLYPHLASTECDEHGSQARSKVPDELKKVFGEKATDGWACSQCVSRAKEQLKQHKDEMRRKRKEEKAAVRDALKQSREDAKKADVELSTYMAGCNESIVQINAAKADINHTRGSLKGARVEAERALKALQKAKDTYEGIFERVREIDGTLENQIEALETAYRDSDSCYNTLQEKLEEADSLWDNLGKNAKKKRDKVKRREVLELLKNRDTE